VLGNDPGALKLVDKALVEACPSDVQLALPEGAQWIGALRLQVLAFADSEPGQRFLRALRCAGRPGVFLAALVPLAGCAGPVAPNSSSGHSPGPSKEPSSATSPSVAWPPLQGPAFVPGPSDDCRQALRRSDCGRSVDNFGRIGNEL
jgi:hypothetical protein